MTDSHLKVSPHGHAKMLTEGHAKFLSRGHLKLFLVFLGLYFSVGFFILWPDAKTLLITQGALGSMTASGGVFPNLLARLPVRWGIEAWVLASLLYGLLLMSTRLMAWVPWILAYSWVCLADIKVLPVTFGFYLMLTLLLCLGVLGIWDARKPLARIPTLFPKWALGPWLILLGTFLWWGDSPGIAALLVLFNPSWIPAQKIAAKKLIVFFDGHCGLCNSSVDFLMLEDLHRHFRYSPLQSEAAEKARGQGLLPSPQTPGAFESLIVQIDGQVFQKSTGVLKLGSYLGGLWRPLAFLGQLIPVFVRDPIYEFVARHRYKVFGRSENCRLPSREERALFL